jgi:hypothetical protein
LCVHYQGDGLDLESCFEEISWDFHLKFTLKDGLDAISLKPVIVHSKLTRIETFPSPPKKEESSSPPAIWTYWKIFWSDMIPDMDIRFARIEFINKEKLLTFDLSALKERKNLTARALDFTLLANPEGFTLKAPSPYVLPIANKTLPPFHLIDFILAGEVKSSGIKLKSTGALDPIDFVVTSKIDLPLKDDFPGPKFIKQVLLATNGKLNIVNVKEKLKKYGPKKYNELPAPFLPMNGDIITDVITHDASGNGVDVEATSLIRLASPKQVFDMDFKAHVALDTADLKTGLTGLTVDFKKIALQLPRLGRKSLPPQFKPDGRIKSHLGTVAKEKKDKEQSDLDLHLTALAPDGVHLKTDLLDEDLRFNFDLLVEKGELQKGHVLILPLKTKIFKRPIRVDHLRIDFQFPLEPVVEGIIKFPLPEYKITLKLEGPLSKPRYTFTSDPPLPDSDIYAVLLFGRPMNDLDSNDKGAAQKTNQILSQGLLSLSVLYFLAGSPVEYVGYDPEGGGATAQFGLGSKTSLRVGAGSGEKSTGVRRSLGKGWYLDTSVQSPNTSSGRDQNNYGVMLERIIAY